QAMIFRPMPRRALLGAVGGAALLAGGRVRRAFAAPAAGTAHDPMLPVADPAAAAPGGVHVPYVPVVTPNGTTLPFTLENGVKVFPLVAEPVKREFAPGMIVNTWGYNGQCPGPTIEAVEGDRVRIFVTNKLPERTSVHWHGVLLPNGM